jgi:glutaredoxin
MSVQLTLYTRNDCHLCEDMKQALSKLAIELDFMTRVVLIENNEELERAFGARIPVLMLEEKIVCENFLNKAALDKAIAKYVDEKHS